MITCGLTTIEDYALRKAEQTIQDGLKTFCNVADAFIEIKTRRLYRGRYASFKEYCHKRWEIKQYYAPSLFSAKPDDETFQVEPPVVPKSLAERNDERELSAESFCFKQMKSLWMKATKTERDAFIDWVNQSEAT